jgi:hypothetical protein
MKFKTTIILFILILSGFFLIPACVPDDDPIEDDPREKYLGAWLCTESTSISYTVTISKDPSNSTQILMNNFHHLGVDEDVFALVAGKSLQIIQQTACQGSLQISGDAVMETDNRIRFQYYVNDFADIDTIQAVFTK